MYKRPPFPRASAPLKVLEVAFNVPMVPRDNIPPFPPVLPPVRKSEFKRVTELEEAKNKRPPLVETAEFCRVQSLNRTVVAVVM